MRGFVPILFWHLPHGVALELTVLGQQIIAVQSISNVLQRYLPPVDKNCRVNRPQSRRPFDVVHRDPLLAVAVKHPAIEPP